jgi:hypothetical protein
MLLARLMQEEAEDLLQAARTVHDSRDLQAAYVPVREAQDRLAMLETAIMFARDGQAEMAERVLRHMERPRAVSAG